MHPDDAEVAEAFEQVDGQEKEVDPGELVSVWYAMKKMYEATLVALKDAANQLNAIGDTLRDSHGIAVPRVSDGISPVATGQVEVSQIVAPLSLAPDPVADQPTPNDGSWSPPSQGPVNIEVSPTATHFIDELRKDAGAGGDEKNFAAQIANIFSSFENFGRS